MRNIATNFRLTTRSVGELIGHYGWIWIATLALFAFSAIIAPGSVTRNALLAMLPFAGMLAIVAVGQTLVIQQRGIDMSSLGAIAFGGVLVSMWSAQGLPLAAAVLGTLAAGALVGVTNGLLVTRWSVPPIVATLATGAILVGAVRQISKGTPISAPVSLSNFATHRLVGLPYSLLVALLFIVIVAVVTRRSVYGRRFVAVGVNPTAASSAGIPAELYQVGAYAAASLCFVVAGMLLAGYIGNASQSAGVDYLLPGIAAVVVGGTPLTGGRGSVVASGVAALFMTQLGQMVLSMGATNAAQLFLQALAIILAVGLRQLNLRSAVSRVAGIAGK
jgi:ribose transport system permease protein